CIQNPLHGDSKPRKRASSGLDTLRDWTGKGALPAWSNMTDFIPNEPLYLKGDNGNNCHERSLLSGL
ncbi:MAG: hypothetical protein ACPHK2_03550, partial [Candidatus Poseidoniaceae archaeon]